MNTAALINDKKIATLGDTQILQLGEIIRYNNRVKIRLENVAEHSFYVVTTVLKICKMYNIDSATKAKALEFAAVHDIPEAITGDIGYDTKEGNKLLREALEVAEIKGLQKYMPEYLDSYLELLKEEKEETTAYLIVKLADTVSVLQYSNLELELGNKTRSMELINKGSYERVQDLIERLENALGKEAGEIMVTSLS